MRTVNEQNEMSRRVRPRCRAAAAVIAVAVVPAACGSEGSSAPASVVVPGTEQSTDTDTGTDVSIDDTVSVEASGEITSSTPGAAVTDPATVVLDGLLDDFNAQDAEGVAGVFGDDVGFTLESGEVVFGADAAAFWQGYFGKETGERSTDAFHASDGLAYFLAQFTLRGGHSWPLVFDVEMNGERLVRIGARARNFVEVVATRKIDHLHQAFNDQDLDGLNEEFEGITYTSPSGVDVTGPEAAEHWADGIGVTITRTTGVFAIGDRTAVFATEHSTPGGLSTEYVVEVEVSPGREVTSMTERRREP